MRLHTLNEIMTRTLPLLAAPLLLASACTGDFQSADPSEDPGAPDPGTDDPLPEPEPGDDANERLLFMTTVEPILKASCDGVGCHGTFPPAFLAGDIYDNVAGTPVLHGNFTVEGAQLLTTIETGHYIGYSEEEKSAIETWILAEASLGTEDVAEDVPLTTRQVLAQFSGCMTLDNWEEADMGDWARYNADGNQCRGCHNAGLSGFNTNGDSEVMFETNRLITPNPFILGFFTVDQLADPPAVVPAHGKLDLMGDGGGPGGIHPQYSYNENNEYYQRLQEFHDLTMLYMQQNPACKDAVPPDGV